MPNALDFSSYAEPATDAKALDFSAQADDVSTLQRAFRAQHGADVPLPADLTLPSAPSGTRAGDVLTNQSIGVGDAFSASLLRTLNALPFIAGGLQNLAGDEAGASRNFALADAGKAQADQLERAAAEASHPAAVAGSILGIVPKLAAPEVLALDAVSHGTDLASSALQQNKDLGTAYTLGGIGTAAGTAGLVLPPAVPGGLLTRLASGAAINAGLGTGELAAEHAVAPDVVAAPTVEDAATQGGIGALLAAVLGHGARARTPEERLVADPEPQGLPRGADYSAQAEPVRPTAPNPGPVHVDAAGTAATVPQGASAFAQALAARMAGVEPGLPEPAVRVDAQGNAMTTADQHAAMQPVPPAEPDPLGLTERLRALVAADPRSAREGAPIVPEGPRALPAPVVAVDRTGQAMTPMQQAQARAAEAAKAAERAQLGITPDIERTQGVRWSKQADYANLEAERLARLKELDDAIAAREAKNKPARGMNARPDESTDDALTFLAKSGGLDRRMFVSEGLDPKLARAPENLTRGGASRPLFRAQGNGGLTLDQAAEALWQHGYLDSQDNNAALDLILHGVNQGEMAYSIHRAPQDDLLSLKQARQDADHHVTDDYADVPFSRKPADARTAAGLTREQFLGSPRITPDSNAAELTPKALTTVTSAPAEPFMGGRYEAKFSPDGAVVLDRGKAIASYNFGDTLAVAKPYRRQGIATELVAEWRRRYPASATAKTRTKAAQRVQERAFDRLAGDPRFSFAGERARTADRGALQQAQAMEAMGRDSVPDRYGNQPGSPEDTHMATGWHRGVDGKWRFEIDDSQATLDPDLTAKVDENQPLRLGGVLHHDALFSAYPELARVRVKIDPNLKGLGVYHGGDNAITIRDPYDYAQSGDGSLKSVLLHEIQHAIQNHEGFARGGSTAGELEYHKGVVAAVRENIAGIDREVQAARAKGDAKEVARLLEKKLGLQTKLAEVSNSETLKGAASDSYRRLAGEVESRNTQRRMNMDASERRAVPPTETADVPRHQQIVRFNADRANAEPASHADLDAIAKYNRVLTRYIGADVHLAPATHVPDDAVAALAGIDRLLGGRTIPVDNHNRAAIDFDGVTLQDGTRLVDAEATAPLVTVTLHETFHQMEKDDPDLAGEVHAYIREHGATHAYHAVLQERARQNGEDPERIGHDRAVSELSADAVADAMSDPAFLEGMAKRNPGLFRRVADAIMASLNLVLKHLRRSLGSSSYLDDVQAFRDHLAGIMDRYAQRVQARARGEAAPERGASTEPALSRKPADDQTQTPAFRKWFGDSKVVDAEGKPLVVYHGTQADIQQFKGPTYFSESPKEASAYTFAGTLAKREKALAKQRYQSAEDPKMAGQRVPYAGIIGDIAERGTVHATDQGVARVNDDGTVTVFTDLVERKGSYDSKTGTVQLVRGDGRGAFRTLVKDSRESIDRAFPPGVGMGGNVTPVYLSIQNPKHMDAHEANRFGARLGGTPDAWRAAVAELEAQGYDGIVTESDDPGFWMSGDAQPQHWIPFRPEQIKSATGNRGTFDPEVPSILFSRKPPPSEAEYLQDMPSRRPGESQSAYLRRITRKNGEEIKAATALVKQQRALGRVALRGMMATQARQMAIADAALDAARKTFDKTPDVINFASVHQWETGQPIADADFRHFVATMQDGFDQRIAEIQRLAPGALQSLIEHYMPHLYEDSGKAAKWYQNVLGKRPLEGDKSFLKQRTWPTLKEAMASGLKPISPNPVDWVLMKYAQMDKFIGLLRLKEEFTRRGWLMKMEPGQRAPEGFARVDDPAFQVAGGLQGYFAVPELIAKDINNYLAPGLSKYGAWRSVRAVQNAMVSWNLGWSAFHAGFTSIDNAVTHGAVGLQRLVDGDLSGGLMALVKAVPTMVTSPFEGGKLNRQWTGRESADPHTAALLDLLEQGGARMKMGNASAEYNNALPQVMRTIRRLQAPGALADGLEALQRRLTREPAKILAETGWGTLKGVGKAISAIGEVGSFLIHHVLVPNQKMAARVTLLKFELDRYAQQLGKQRGDYTGILSVMNPDVARQLATDVVDKVDFRLGQMTYDNFFYPKIAREIAQLLVMAPGWQAGAFQTMTGGLKDIGRLAKPEKLVGPLDKAGRITDAHRGRFTNNLANLAMLFLMVGGGNALYQWLVSGIEPDEMKDLVAPRTGRKNADDSDERIVLPSYMKDHYEFFHHPLAMASHKLHPAWRLMWEIGHNEDYFGTMIRDPHHPLGQQAKELAGYLVKSMLPFTATNAAKVAENGGGVGEHVANFVGITPASASLARTPFQAFVAKGGAKGWEFPAATPAEAEYQDRMRKAETAMRTGQTPATDGLTARDLAKLKRRVQTLKPELQFDRLSLADKLDAYDMATPEERRRYHLTDILRLTNPRRSVAFRRLPEEEQQAMLEQLRAITRHSEAIGP